MNYYKTFVVIFIFLSANLLPVNPYEAKVLYKEQVEENVYFEDPIKTDFTFDDLVSLSQESNLKGSLKEKLENHLSMVYVINRNNELPLTKPYLRVAQWNIKRGFNINEIKEIFSASNDFGSRHSQKLRKKAKKRFLDELNALSNAEIICLNEVDIGLPRTKYKNIALEVANPLKWNIAYVTEFVEVGPLFKKLSVDKSLYKGLHGNVIISKYPIVSAEVIRLPNFFDWYSEEIKKRQSPIEHFRKLGAMAIFDERILHGEVRHGGRNALVADIKLPNDKIITVINTHFEDRAYPDQRLKQLTYLLEKIKDKKTPVVLAGDFNTCTSDTKPTSFQKEVEKRIRDPHFIARSIGSSFIPGLSFGYGPIAVAVSKLLQYKDPFFPNIPVIFPNHERKFYKYLKVFKFSDNYGFDLCGEKERSYKRKGGLLSCSNQRHWKGFKSTYKFEKPRIIAYFKLDWFFVKPIGNNFLPYNGRTFKTLNRIIKGGISDHNPITVDLKI